MEDRCRCGVKVHVKVRGTWRAGVIVQKTGKRSRNKGCFWWVLLDLPKHDKRQVRRRERDIKIVTVQEHVNVKEIE